MQTADIIASFVVFLHSTEEEWLDRDTAARMMDAMAGQLRELDKGFLRELIDAFATISTGYSGEAQLLIRDIAHDFRLEETLAADDPLSTTTLKVARIIANIVLFLETTDEEQLNLDTAVGMTEVVAHLICEMDKDFLRELIDAFVVIAPEYRGEAQNLVRNIVHDFYLEEELAMDDPVRLAELDALRDARDQIEQDAGRR